MTSRTGAQPSAMSWLVPAHDGTRTEHGFVSLWAQGDGALGLAWLDGRNTGGGGHDAHDAAAGAMTLRAAVWILIAAWLVKVSGQGKQQG